MVRLRSADPTRQGHGDLGLGEIEQSLPSFGGPIELGTVASLIGPFADGAPIDAKGLGSGLDARYTRQGDRLLFLCCGVGDTRHLCPALQHCN